MKNIKIFIKIISFIIIMFLCYSFCANLVRDKSVEAVSKEYASYGKNKFDVIFLGTSVMKNDLYPMELYQDYGIASYNLASGNQSFATSYYLAKQAIREQKPKILVLDCFYAAYDKYYISDAILHYATDMMSWREKIELIHDIVPREKQGEFLLEFLEYHNRWNELTASDFSYSEHKQYGTKVHYASKPIKEYEIVEEKEELPSIPKEYLYKIIDLCKENNVSLILTTLPVDFGANHGTIKDMLQNQKYYNKIQDIASENHIAYLNFMYLLDETGIDLQKDFDGGFHLNAYGAEKMTSYLGEFIDKNYDLPDVRENPDYEFMKKDLVEFEKYKSQLRLKSAKDILTYFDAICDLTDCTVYISIKDIQGYSLTEEIAEKMKKAGLDSADILLEKSYHSYIACLSNGETILEKIGNGEEPSHFEGVLNNKTVILESRTLKGGNLSSIQINGVEYSKNKRGFNIVVIDQETNQVIDSINFDTHVPEIPSYR